MYKKIQDVPPPQNTQNNPMYKKWVPANSYAAGSGKNSNKSS